MKKVLFQGVMCIVQLNKNVWKSDRCWEPEIFENLTTWTLENFENIKNDPWDMLNNFSYFISMLKRRCL